MSKCNKTKNPCKICLGSVTQKTGLRCQGACQNWVHYKCLHYTRGKIQDIKAGRIKVNCPCPDCNIDVPREIRTDMPYCCTNQACPANLPPRCVNTQCPVNFEEPPKDSIASRNDDTAKTLSPNTTRPLNTCGTDCKKYSSPAAVEPPVPAPCNSCNVQTCPSPPQKASSSNFLRKNSADMQGDCAGKGSAISLTDVEHMCTAVGQLTNQINEMMQKMQEVVNSGGSGRRPRDKFNSDRKRNSSPKPCFCPGNPNRKC